MRMRLFSKQASDVKPSVTLSLNADAKRLTSEGFDVINFCAGEPSEDTSQAVKKAATKALKLGYTKYLPTGGTKPLRIALAEKFKKENNINTSWEEVLVGHGAKQLLASIFQILCQKGDEVIIPLPGWNTYENQVKLAGAKAKCIKLKHPFTLTATDIESAIAKSTKVIVINSPSNPTGQVIDFKELLKIGQLVLKYKLFIISDEVYENYIYDGLKHTSIASLSDEIRKRTITVNSFSKTYAMTGWRIGYAHAEKTIVNKLINVNSHITSGASSISQYAALEALKLPRKKLEFIRKRYERKRDKVYNKLKGMSSVSAVFPKGAFYFFVNISKCLKNSESSENWSRRLLRTNKVAVVPGEAFGVPNYIRLSFTLKDKDLTEGLNRIKQFFTGSS